MAPDSTQAGLQVVWLLVLALPIASVAWTVTHEEIFKEPRELCIARSRTSRRLVERKFFYVFTCEYCFSHYVTAGVLALTDYRLLLDHAAVDRLNRGWHVWCSLGDVSHATE